MSPSQSGQRPVIARLFDRDGSPFRITERPGEPPRDEFQIQGPVEFGRQNERESLLPPGSWIPKAERRRYIIADINRNNISRAHLLVEPAGEGVRLSNLSRGPIRLEGHAQLEVDEKRREIPLIDRLCIYIGDMTLQLAPVSADLESSVISVPDSTLALGRDIDLARTFAANASAKAEGGTLDNESLVKWVQAILGVLQGAAGAMDFFPRAARTLVDLIGLDSGRVLVQDGGRWVVRSLQTADRVAEKDDWMPSREVLSRVLQEKKTCFIQAAALASAEVSLAGVTAVVAAPILNRANEVVGVLYGERRSGALSRRTIINRLEILLVEVLASGVAVGQARLEQEKKALRAEVQMEQFFTPGVARHLANHPEDLKGRDVEVTMLSCDIRGFSRICERLQPSPDKTLAWLNDVLGALSECVLRETGVLVDYVGDELMNMWGAPEAQPDHARRACRAALMMMAEVPKLNERWQQTVQEEMGVRIGVNSGLARVGNVGSDVKFKYGALGNTINLTSRVQGAAKYLRTPLLITEATKQQLDDSFQTRRLAQVQVINIKQPLTLYELAPPRQPGWVELKSGYEEALAAFEAREFRTAARILGTLITQPRYRQDGPSLILMQRAVSAIIDEPKQEEFSPVWELPSK
jgi:adenylate cyclase